MGQAPPQSRRPLILAALVVLGAGFGGLGLYRAEHQHLRQIVETDLQTIAQLKAAQIAAWRTERLGDAAVLTESPFFVEEAARWLRNPSAAGRDHLITRFRSLCDHYAYSDVLLVDGRGQVRLRLSGEGLALHPEATDVLAAAVAKRRAVLSDLHAGGTNQHPHLDVAAPLFPGGDATSESVGAVILQVDAEQFLYPLIQTWPTHSQTAETLLVVEDGNDALFLNDLRYQQDAGLRLRIPLTRTDVPAVMAVRGRRGVVNGRDYRGVEVVSVLEAIPDSPWLMVAKEDAAEAFAMQQSRPVLIVLLILAVAAIASVSVGVVWQRNQKTHYQSLLLAEHATRESEDKYRTLFEGSHDAILTLEPPAWMLTTGNAAAVKLFGAESETQLLTCSLWELSPQMQADGRSSAEKARDVIETAMREGSHFFEWTHQRLTGEQFCGTVLLSRVERDGHAFLQATVRDVTERKHIEDELRWKTAFLEAQVNASIDGILVVDRENRRLLMNPQIARQWDVPQHILDDPDDAPLLDYVVSLAKHPDQFLAKVKHLYDHPNETSRDEIEFRNGMVLDRYSSPVIDEEGHYYGRVWTFRDITSRRRAEEVTRSRLSLLMAAGECSSDEIMQLALDEIESLTGSSIGFYHFVDADQETLTLQAWSSNTLNQMCSAEGKGRHYSVSQAGIWVDCIRQRQPVIHNDYASEPHRKGLPVGHAPVTREMTIPIMRGQRIVAVIGVGNKATDYDMVDVEIASLLGDFSWEVIERKRAQEELAVTAARWDATFNSIADLVSVQGLDHKLVAVNKAYAETFAKTPQELLGASCYHIVHQTESPWPGCPCKTVFETQEPSRVEIFEPRLGAHLEVSVSPLFDAAGQLAGCVHIAKNISERKQAEERQAELVNRLAETNQELKQFAYIVSHDLKAPLRAIRTLSDWLVADYHDKLDSQGQENLELLGNRVDRMANLIDGVLQYSRASRIEPGTTPVDLNTLVREVVGSLDVPEHIMIRIDGDLPIVKGDATRFTQIFQNLLSNAIKYMDKPRGEVIVGCVEDDGYWRFSVSDNGPGIEEKHFEKIFQLFQTLAPRDTRESTGVGLAIIKKVVEMYGGRVWIESELGSGSTFFFTLPQASCETSHATCEALMA